MNPIPIVLAILVGYGCGLQDPAEPGLLVRPTVDDDPTLPAIDLPGTRVHAEIVGPEGAPAIVFLHGGPGNDAEYMQAVADPVDGASLADDHRLVFWDQRGTGLSRRHDRDELSMPLYQADLEALIDAVSPDRPVLIVGHSWGALYAAPLLARRPDRVRGAVFVNGQALTRAIFESNVAPIDLDPFAEWLADPLWSRTILSADDHARADHALAAAFGTTLPRQGNHGLARNLRPGAAVFKLLNQEWSEDYDWSVGLDAYPEEILLLAGTADEVQGVALQERQLALYGRARIERMEGSGHSDPFTVHAPALVRSIRAYLQQLEVTR